MLMDASMNYSDIVTHMVKRRIASNLMFKSFLFPQFPLMDYDGSLMWMRVVVPTAHITHSAPQTHQIPGFFLSICRRHNHIQSFRQRGRYKAISTKRQRWIPIRHAARNKDPPNKVMVSLSNKVTASSVLTERGKRRTWRSSLVRPATLQRCDRSIQREKGGDISDLSPVESKWINPSYRNHSSWLHPSNAKLHYTGTTAARCVPHPPKFPQLLCLLALLCIIPDENIICLLSARLSHTNPNPQKWRLSYAGIMSPAFKQERLITRVFGLASFCGFASHLRDGADGAPRDDKVERKEQEKKGRGDEITLSSAGWWQQNNVEEGASRQVCTFSHPTLPLPSVMRHIR